MNYKRCRTLLVIFSLFFFVSACHYNSAVEEEELQIRVENASSSHGMRNIQVTFYDGEIDYGDLDPGERSEYETVSRAYRYQFVEMTVDGDTATYQPVDFVGEELLDAGRYTYELDINEEIFDSDPEYSVILSLKKNE